MSVTPETRRSSNDSVLKTTTWGALIAFTATIMVAVRSPLLALSPAGLRAMSHRDDRA